MGVLFVIFWILIKEMGIRLGLLSFLIGFVINYFGLDWVIIMIVLFVLVFSLFLCFVWKLYMIILYIIVLDFLEILEFCWLVVGVVVLMVDVFL